MYMSAKFNSGDLVQLIRAPIGLTPEDTDGLRAGTVGTVQCACGACTMRFVLVAKPTIYYHVDFGTGYIHSVPEPVLRKIAGDADPSVFLAEEELPRQAAHA